ncbi:MAG: efflux RND transporter periplasmic adaptor subunit, partial [Candidatus Acidiferrales bacterium]
TFAAIFAIHGTSGKLMPDLSAAVDVVLDRSQNAVVVPNQSVVHADGKEYVWLKSGMSYEKHQVTTGPSNDLQTVIAAGLTPGNVVEDDPAATHGKS